MKVDQEQIKQWKQKYGNVFKIEVDGKMAFLRSPSRKVLGYASTTGQKDPMKFNEILLNNCWLAGDEVIKTDDSLFMGVSAKLAEIIEVKEATLEKL